MSDTPNGKRRRSALEAWDGCPARYNAVYNLGTVDQGDESERGIAFHAIAERYVQRLIAARTPMDAEELAGAVQDGIAATNCPTAQIPDVQDLADRWAAGFELDIDAVLAAEEHLESRKFTWRPDLVYVYPTHLEIVDWKTYYRGFTDEQARKEFQARFYLVQAKDIWPNFPEYWFTFWFVRLNYKVTIKVKPDEIDTWRPQIEGVLAGLEDAERTGVWPAKPGSHCGLCRVACPVVDDAGRLPARLKSAGERDQAAGEILALEQKLKALKKALNAYCLADGPFVLNGQWFGHAPNDSVTYPAVPVIDLFTKAGVDPSFLTVSKTAVGKPAKALNADAQADLAKLAVVKSGWRFGHKKAGADADEPDE